MGGAAAAQEATPKPGAKKPIAKKNAHSVNCAKDEQTRVGGHHGNEIANASAKKVTHAAGKITWIICGAIAKAMGASRAAPLVVYVVLASRSRRC